MNPIVKLCRISAVIVLLIYVVFGICAAYSTWSCGGAMISVASSLISTPASGLLHFAELIAIGEIITLLERLLAKKQAE